MSRIFAVAQTELLGLVRSKFFIVGLLIMPVFVGGVSLVMGYASSRVDRTDRRLAVIDRTGTLYAALAEGAETHNREAGDGDDRTAPRFLLEQVPLGEAGPDIAARLSDRVKRDEIFAFIDIPADVLNADSTSTLDYYSENTSYTRLSSWLATTLSAAIQEQRLAHAGVDPALVARLMRKTDLTSFGLVERRPDGTLTPAMKIDEVQRFGLPVFFLVVMFMSVMSNAQHLINTIIEEKMSKISEVLLGSITAFQLLAGKLIGVVVVSLILAIAYLVGGIYTLLTIGRPDLIDVSLLAWFLVFLICASLLYGALFQALSSACSDLKDAQSLLQPAMMILVVAYVSSFAVIRAPDSPMATVMSLIPLLTPFAMLLRLAMHPGPPLWQAVLGVVLLMGSTVGVVWAAGRVFRIGLLMQGKAPNLPELIRWIGKD